MGLSYEMQWNYNSLALNMNVSKVRYELVLKLGFGNVYKIKNARSMVDGLSYSVSIR
jgi:hypothetical protein